MRKGIGKYALIGVGGLIGLMVIGMVIAAIFSSPEEVKGVNLIAEWMWYRVGFYVVVLLAWTPICQFITRPRPSPEDEEFTAEEKEEFLKDRAADIEYLKTLRWKVALLFVFFEFVIIQQFGL